MWKEIAAAILYLVYLKSFEIINLSIPVVFLLLKILLTSQILLLGERASLLYSFLTGSGLSPFFLQMVNVRAEARDTQARYGRKRSPAVLLME